MIHLLEDVSSRLMNSVEIRNELPMARRQRLFLQDLTEPEDINQRIAQIMARFADPRAQRLAGSGSAERLGESRVAGPGGIVKLIHGDFNSRRRRIAMSGMFS